MTPSGAPGALERGGKTIGIGQPAAHGDEQDAETAGKGRARPVGGRCHPILEGRVLPLALTPGGMFEIRPSTGDQLLDQPRVHAHDDIIGPMVDNFKNIPI